MKYLHIVTALVTALLAYLWISGQSVPLWIRIAIFVYLLAATAYVGYLTWRNRKG